MPSSATAEESWNAHSKMDRIALLMIHGMYKITDCAATKIFAFFYETQEAIGIPLVIMSTWMGIRLPYSCDWIIQEAKQWLARLIDWRTESGDMGTLYQAVQQWTM
jgi:hypothetical protein